MPYEILNSEQFWVLVAFLIFVGLIFNPVRKILTKNLDEKILEIKNSIDEAEKLKKEAQISLGEVKKRQSDVKKEIEVIQKEVKEKILFYEEQSKINLKQQLEKRHSLNLMKVDQLTREANNEIHNYVLKLSLSIVEEILEKKLNINEKQNLIDQSIDELKIALKN